MGQKTRTFIRRLFRMEKRRFIVQYSNQQKPGDFFTYGRVVVVLEHDEEWTSSIITTLEKDLKEQNNSHRLFITGVNSLKG